MTIIDKERRFMKLKLVIIICLFFSIYSNAAELKGKVIHISDWDTIHLLTTNKVKYKIRLDEIDAPENSQAFGNKSKENLKKYIYNKDVVVNYSSRDQYDRVLGTIYLNKQDINLQQIKDGYAWVYKKYSNNSTYYKAEKEARNSKKGLWADKYPIEPWIFRKNK